MAEIHVGDIGTKFLMTVTDQDGLPVDCSGATTLSIIFKKPDGTVVEQDADEETDGADGKIFYTTLQGDLDMAGHWKIQAFIETTSGQWYSNVETFRVYRNILA